MKRFIKRVAKSFLQMRLSTRVRVIVALLLGIIAIMVANYFDSKETMVVIMLLMGALVTPFIHSGIKPEKFHSNRR